MKNKKAIYFLLPVVGLIWGIIIYKIFFALHKNQNIPANKEINLAEINPQNQNDTFSISANYRDPFLGKQINLNTSSEIKKKVMKKEVPRLQKLWPEIKYNGIIKNQHSKKELALLQINGTEYLMKTNDIVSEIKLLRMFKDSVIVVFGKEKKTVLK